MEPGAALIFLPSGCAIIFEKQNFFLSLGWFHLSGFPENSTRAFSELTRPGTSFTIEI